MRKKNTRPTLIYWLVDTRPETILAYRCSNGKPFYCGKSVRPKGRLQEHKMAAARGGTRPVLTYLRECGDQVRLVILETVPAHQNWQVRERHWIKISRKAFPDLCNVADGGEGVPGFIPNEQQRKNIGAATRARSQCPDYRAKLSAAHKGQRLSPDRRARCAEQLRTIQSAPDYKAANAARAKARWENPEYRARMTLLATGRKLSVEAREKVAASKRGKPLSADHKIKVGNAHRGKTISVEHRAALSAANKGRSNPKSEADKAALRAGWARRRERLAAENAQYV